LLEIRLQNIGKRFNRHWTFRSLSHQFNSGSVSSIIGANGSGKSTLVKILSGFLTPTEGEVQFTHLGSTVSKEDLYSQVAYCAPYVKVPGDLTLLELLHFHNGLKPLACSTEEFLDICQLAAHSEKPIKHFSSGMQQRARLALAIMSDVPLIVLDEPSSNLDRKGIRWFQELMNTYSRQKTIIIGSNHNQDEIQDYPIAIDLGTGAISK